MDMRSDQLHHILVAADDDDIQPGLLALLRKSPDNIVRFEPILFQADYIERFHQRREIRELRYQVVRSLVPIGLVFRIHFVPKGFCFTVKNDGKVIRLFLAHNLCQHTDKSIQRVGRKALGVGKNLPDPVKRAEDVRGAID